MLSTHYLPKEFSPSVVAKESQGGVRARWKEKLGESSSSGKTREKERERVEEQRGKEGWRGRGPYKGRPGENVEDHPREEFRTGWEPAAHAIPLGGPLSSASGWDHPGQPRPVRGPFAPATILHPIIDRYVA